MSAIHPAAAHGFSAEAATYATGRPEYPDAIVNWMKTALGVGPSTVALDLGAGTGKFTRRLVETGAHVIAVEPVADMLARLTQQLPAVEAHAGTAEAIPVPDESVDLVACAQAFHWFASEAALAEIRRVLKPGGHLLLIWNVRDETTPWVKALTDIMTPHEGDAPRFHTGAWRTVFPADGFSPLEETEFPHGHTGSVQNVVVDRVMSVSFIAAMPLEGQAHIRAEIADLIAATPELSAGHAVTFPYTTRAFTSRKTV